MFENAPEILLTLQIETMQNFSGRNDPLLLGTELFCTALKNLPAETSADYPYPGIFGLGSVAPEVREAWKKRIAAGAGLKVEAVNRLLKSFEQMRSMLKQFSGPGMGKKLKRMRGLGGFGGFPGF